MIERTLVLIKPDGVERAVVGEIVSRFEKVGLKIVGLKMIKIDTEKAGKHYDKDDIITRRGENVYNYLLDYVTSGPVVAIVLEGIQAIEQVRKMAGPTQPKEAAPGTIRGDYCHVSYAYCDDKGIAVRNVLHASADEKDAQREIDVWFNQEELVEYQVVHEKHTR